MLFTKTFPPFVVFSIAPPVPVIHPVFASLKKTESKVEFVVVN